MIALVQRVTSASVEVDGKIIGAIGRGILALVGVEREDTEAQASRSLKWHFVAPLTEPLNVISGS